MKESKTTNLKGSVLSVLALISITVSASALQGCAAVAVGAGAAGAIAYTDRGAKSEVKGNPAEVKEDTLAVFKELGLQTTSASMKDGGKEQDLEGKKSGMDVSVTIKASDNKGTSSIDVTAREGTVKWNKDYAKDLVARVVKKG